MISLFNIPQFKVNTLEFNHLLHDQDIITEFEEKFCKYVGFDYGCALSSASAGIFLLLHGRNETVQLPSLLPPTVANHVLNSGNKIKFVDDTQWIGSEYCLHRLENLFILDSAQRVRKNNFDEDNAGIIRIYSFYPTKPVAGYEGGMVVSNNKAVVDYVRQMANYGASITTNSWDRNTSYPGWKFYMNSMQASCALQGLKRWPAKQERLKEIQNYYGKTFQRWYNYSLHLYRVQIKEEVLKNTSLEQLIEFLCNHKGIQCGIHYKPLHLNPIYGHLPFMELPNSIKDSKKILSIPFHENLTQDEIDYVIDTIKEYAVCQES